MSGKEHKHKHIELLGKMLDHLQHHRGGAGADSQSSVSSSACSEGPYAGVDAHLRALAGAAEGFGSASIGGLHGKVYHVTSLADEGHGTLRDGCKKTEPLWIVFDVSGTISIAKNIRVQSHKTIDGRGQRIRITNKGLQLKECEHVIICNLEFQRGAGPDADAIQLKPNSKHVWIDRCTLSDYDDGLIDVTRQSSFVTVSRCHFFNHNKTMLIGADPKHYQDRCIRVTIHHCFYDGTKQRHPRVRFGKVHLYNNYTRGWTVYAVCASVEAQILSQHCIYEAGDKKKGFEYYSEKAGDCDHEASGTLRSEDDLFLNGAQGHMQGPNQVFNIQQFYSNYTLERADAALMKKIPRIAGWQNVPLPCELHAVS
jgi:pectate lyase